MSIAPLEKRTASLELTLEQTVSFGESLLAVLKGIVERTNGLEHLVEQSAAFSISIPDLLREISGRVDTLENALKDDANFNRSTEAAFKGFSERINALTQSIPAILKESAASAVAPPEKPAPPRPAVETKAAVSPAATPAVAPEAVREILQRLGVAEAAIGRLSASGQSTFMALPALDALKDSLRSVVERMGVIESVAARISSPEPRLVPSPGLSVEALDPLKDTLKRVTERVALLEAKAGNVPPVAVAPSAAFDPSVSDMLRKLTARVGALESTPAVGSSFDASAFASPDSADSNQLHFLAQASQLYHKTRTVVFVGGENFADNIKYAYLAFCTFAAGLDIATSFLCRTRQQYDQLVAENLPCISPNPADWSSQDARTLISAKLVVLDDIFYTHGGQHAMAHALLKGAKFIQLWHGIPFKEIGLQNLFSERGGKDFRAEILAACGPFDVLVAPAATARHDWERWLSFREFAPIGIPRTDVFFQNLSAKDRINVDEKTLETVQAAAGQNKRVILYAPTFRDHNPSWFETADFGAFATHCRERGWLLFINLHPREQGAVDELRMKYPDISFIQPNTDIFPIAKYSDCLVTDYSSLAFDFLYCDRPVVFYRPDHNDYIARACPLVNKYENLAAGPVTLTVDDLIGAVANVIDRPDMDVFREARAILRRKLFDYQDGKSGTRFCALIQRYLEPGIRFVPVAT